MVVSYLGWVNFDLGVPLSCPTDQPILPNHNRADSGISKFSHPNIFPTNVTDHRLYRAKDLGGRGIPFIEKKNDQWEAKSDKVPLVAGMPQKSPRQRPKCCTCLVHDSLKPMVMSRSSLTES